MKIVKKILLCVMVAVFGLAAVLFAACAEGDNGKPAADNIVNGGFEENADESTWTGWTRSGTAFSARGVVDDEEVNKVFVDKTGDYWFSGLSGGTSQMVGTLTSDPFILSGTGKIAFKMGAAKNGENIYVQFLSGKNVLATVTNTDFDEPFITDQLIRKVVDLSEHIGKTVTIVITDNDKGDADEYGYVNLDDFVMCATEADVEKYEQERADQLAEYGAPSFEEDPTEETVRNGDFETGDLTSWLVLEGDAFTSGNSVIPTSQGYWAEERRVYGHGDYYLDGNNNGAIVESATGSIRSTKFTLGGDGWITFMIGAGNNRCYVAICDADTGDELIKVENDYFHDPNLPLTLLRVYVDASDYIGDVLYIKVVDNNSTSGFAFINVDDFRCSLTDEDVEALELEQYNAVLNETYTTRYNDLDHLREYYANYPYPFPLPTVVFTDYVENKVINPSASASVDLTAYLSEAAAAFAGNTEGISIAIASVSDGTDTVTSGFSAFDMSEEGTYVVTYKATYGSQSAEAQFKVLVYDGTNQVANGGFETGDLTGWTVLTDGWAYAAGHPAGVIDAETYWGEELPYNRSGSYHLDGWNTGVAEAGAWRVRSTTFTLGGSGWISVKMGGNAAAVAVYKADGTQIALYRESRFNDSPSFPDITEGSWADMAVYAMDLSGYIGEKLYIELVDEGGGSWGHAFFDDVITYYETEPDYQNLYDTVQNGKVNGVSLGEVQIAWVLGVNSYSAS